LLAVNDLAGDRDAAYQSAASPARLDRGRLAPLRDDAAELLASLQAALGVDVAQVVFDGLAADEQLGGDR
jgi:hypothetical protein